jgi:hypothetical protein
LLLVDATAVVVAFLSEAAFTAYTNDGLVKSGSAVVGGALSPA